MKKCLLIFFSIIFQICLVQAEPLYILNEYCTNNIYSSAVAALSHCDGVAIKRDIRGIIIRIPFENPEYNFQKITPQLYEKLLCIEYFLAKIKNPVIIEVHTEKIPEGINMKNWEFASVIAGNIGEEFVKSEPKLPVDRIYTVGYGQYMPDINTSNNGGKSDNRIDIIILCSISGE